MHARFPYSLESFFYSCVINLFYVYLPALDDGYDLSLASILRSASFEHVLYQDENVTFLAK
jgi:hypothetical protein